MTRLTPGRPAARLHSKKQGLSDSLRHHLDAITDEVLARYENIRGTNDDNAGTFWDMVLGELATILGDGRKMTLHKI